jgi:hypothetical protein
MSTDYTIASVYKVRDSSCPHPWLNTQCSRSHGLDGLAASCGVGTLVSNDLLSVRASAPVTRFFMRLATTAGRPEEATPSLRRRLCRARKCNGPPPPAPHPRGNTASTTRLRLFEHRPRREDPSFEETPARHESRAGYGHHPHPSPARATAPKTFTKPDTEGAVS